MIADGAGRAVAFRLASGQAHEPPQAMPLLAPLPGVPKWVVADRGRTSHAFREHVRDRDAGPAIPPRRDEAPVTCPDRIRTNRNKVERLWARLTEPRAVATRCEKTARSFRRVLRLAATLDRLKTSQGLARSCSGATAWRGSRRRLPSRARRRCASIPI